MAKRKIISLDIEDYKELVSVRGKIICNSIDGLNISYSKIIRTLIDHYNKTVA